MCMSCDSIPGKLISYVCVLPDIVIVGDWMNQCDILDMDDVTSVAWSLYVVC